jgi:hypothetical protein
MRKRKEKTETIITQGKEGIIPNKTNPLGGTRIQGMRTLMGAIITNANGKITTTFAPTSLVPFAVNLVTIPTIAPKSLTLSR